MHTPACTPLIHIFTCTRNSPSAHTHARYPPLAYRFPLVPIARGHKHTHSSHVHPLPTRAHLYAYTHPYPQRSRSPGPLTGSLDARLDGRSFLGRLTAFVFMGPRSPGRGRGSGGGGAGSPSLNWARALGAQRHREGHGRAGLRHPPGPPALELQPLCVLGLWHGLRARGAVHRCRGRGARRAF